LYDPIYFRSFTLISFSSAFTLAEGLAMVLTWEGSNPSNMSRSAGRLGKLDINRVVNAFLALLFEVWYLGEEYMISKGHW
jgi:hypothetical protein